MIVVSFVPDGGQGPVYRHRTTLEDRPHGFRGRVSQVRILPGPLFYVLLSAAGGILAWSLRGEGETFPIRNRPWSFRDPCR